MIAIIDYDAGNLRSVEKALQYLKEDTVITRDQHEIMKADKVILPGVGSFGDAMNKLHHYQLINVIREVIAKGTPFLGICLGLQLLFEGSEESDGIEGLNILSGKILRIPDGVGLKIPHMGWNSLKINPEAKLFHGIHESYVYFVHSYYLKAAEESIVAATTHYSTLIHASVQKDNVYACQFHPEKSGEVGLTILRNFSNL